MRARTRLHGDFTGRNPDMLAFTTIPYEKGYSFMRMLEEGIGRDRLDLVLRQYFTTHAFRWMDAGGAQVVRCIEDVVPLLRGRITGSGD